MSFFANKKKENFPRWYNNIPHYKNKIYSIATTIKNNPLIGKEVAYARARLEIKRVIVETVKKDLFEMLSNSKYDRLKEIAAFLEYFSQKLSDRIILSCNLRETFVAVGTKQSRYFVMADINIMDFMQYDFQSILEESAKIYPITYISDNFSSIIEKFGQYNRDNFENPKIITDISQ